MSEKIDYVPATARAKATAAIDAIADNLTAKIEKVSSEAGDPDKKYTDSGREYLLGRVDELRREQLELRRLADIIANSSANEA